VPCVPCVPCVQGVDGRWPCRVHLGMGPAEEALLGRSSGLSQLGQEQRVLTQPLPREQHSAEEEEEEERRAKQAVRTCMGLMRKSSRRSRRLLGCICTSWEKEGERRRRPLNQRNSRRDHLTSPHLTSPPDDGTLLLPPPIKQTNPPGECFIATYVDKEGHVPRERRQSRGAQWSAV
jgi:hypothetical protein